MNDNLAALIRIGIIIAAIALVFVFIEPSEAHGGATDDRGCHSEWAFSLSKGELISRNHCHPEKAPRSLKRRAGEICADALKWRNDSLSLRQRAIILDCYQIRLLEGAKR